MEFLPDTSEDCHCTFDECPTIIAQRRLARMSPRQAVIAASKEDPTSHFMNHISRIAMSKPSYRRSGLTPVFLKHIINGKSTAEGGKRYWEYPMMGLINIFAGIYQTNSQNVPEDVIILREMFAKQKEVIDVLSKEMPFLTKAGPANDGRRSIAGKYINYLTRDPATTKAMQNEKTAKIILTCWLNTSPDCPSRMAPTKAIMSMYRQLQDDSNDVLFFESSLKAFKVTTFVSQINFGLKNKKMSAEQMCLEISALSNFARHKYYQTQLLEAHIPKQMMASVRRQVLRPEDDPKFSASDLLLEAGVFVQTMLQYADDKMAMFTKLVDSTCMVEIGAIAFKLGNKSSSYDAEEWREIFERIVHSMGCENMTGCEYHANPEFLEAVKTSFERLTIPTMIALQEEIPVGGDKKFVYQWHMLAKMLGITDKSIRERYRTDRKCCNLACPARNSGVRSGKKSTCEVCQSVFYCDRNCQKDDWQTHKKECKELEQLSHS